jgi:DNA modification methylase
MNPSDHNFSLEWWPIDRPRDYPKNARKWSAQAVDKVAASIREYGWKQPLVCDSEDVIIIGHLRRAAGRRAGKTECPVHVARDLTPEQVRGLRLMDNRSHEEAGWDFDLLGPELIDLQRLGFGLELTGFDEQELARTMMQKTDGLTDPDDCPPVPEAPVSKPGDLWLMGPHRLMCGSCLDQAAVARVLDGGKPTLLITDPPYGVDLDNEWRDRAGLNRSGPADASYVKKRTEGHTTTSMSGDTIADWSPAFALVRSLAIAYVWHATSHMIDVAHGLRSIGFELRQQIIWEKTVAAISRQAYHWKHEPCWYAVRKGQTAKWIGTKDQTTIWEAASPKQISSGSKEQKFDHPTQKPIALMERPIKNHDGAVYEPFGGSGTTLMASETLGRNCYAIEIEPRFVDVIVTRWQNFTGRAAILDGCQKTFEQVKLERRATDSAPESGEAVAAPAE